MNLLNQLVKGISWKTCSDAREKKQIEGHTRHSDKYEKIGSKIDDDRQTEWKYI